MKRITYHSLSAGPGGVRQAGSTHEVSNAEADALIAGGFAQLAPTKGPRISAGEPEKAGGKQPAGGGETSGGSDKPKKPKDKK